MVAGGGSGLRCGHHVRLRGSEDVGVLAGNSGCDGLERRGASASPTCSSSHEYLGCLFEREGELACEGV